MTNKEKAMALINTFATGDTEKAKELLASGYIQHNLAYGTGAEAFVGSVAYLASTPVKTTVNNIRAFEDVDKTEDNRELVRNFLVDVMQGKHPEKTPEYFEGDTYVQHNIGIADGQSGLGAALEALDKQGIAMIYDTVHQVLAQGNYVLSVSEGTFGGAATSYYDLWRVENGKIAEHWDVMETIAAKDTWANENGKF